MERARIKRQQFSKAVYEAESLELEMTCVEHRMGKPDQQRLYRKKKKITTRQLPSCLHSLPNCSRKTSGSQLMEWYWHALLLALLVGLPITVIHPCFKTLLSSIPTSLCGHCLQMRTLVNLVFLLQISGMWGPDS